MHSKINKFSLLCKHKLTPKVLPIPGTLNPGDQPLFYGDACLGGASLCRSGGLKHFVCEDQVDKQDCFSSKIFGKTDLIAQAAVMSLS